MFKFNFADMSETNLVFPGPAVYICSNNKYNTKNNMCNAKNKKYDTSIIQSVSCVSHHLCFHTVEPATSISWMCKYNKEKLIND